MKSWVPIILASAIGLCLLLWLLLAIGSDQGSGSLQNFQTLFASLAAIVAALVAYSAALVGIEQRVKEVKEERKLEQLRHLRHLRASVSQLGARCRSIGVPLQELIQENQLTEGKLAADFVRRNFLIEDPTDINMALSNAHYLDDDILSDLVTILSKIELNYRIVSFCCQGNGSIDFFESDVVTSIWKSVAIDYLEVESRCLAIGKRCNDIIGASE